MRADLTTPPLAGMQAAWQAGQKLVSWPFDALRLQHAQAVQAGLMPNSMLASRNFEQALGALERLTLGPLARRV